jgi:uncharacterized protein
MMRAYKVIPAGIVIIIILLSIVRFFTFPSSKIFVVSLISPGGEVREIFVEIADTDSERQQGLMHRSTLPGGRGMLFLFEQPSELSFWMKNTLIALEVLYFDVNGNFVSRQSMIPCEADPCPSYPSNGVATYALEVGSDDPISDGVGQGWRLKF